MRRPFLLLTLALAGCGDAVKDDHFAQDVKEERAEPRRSRPEAAPVRIGELGPNFAACEWVGTTRHLDASADERLTVRAAPFEEAAESGEIAAGAHFFICTRSHDQRWLGVVYDGSGALAPACGVSRPVPARRRYEGPCRAGWVAAAFVKQIAG